MACQKRAQTKPQRKHKHKATKAKHAPKASIFISKMNIDGGQVSKSHWLKETATTSSYEGKSKRFVGITATRLTLKSKVSVLES